MVEDYAHCGKAPDGLHHFKACEIVIKLILLAEFVFRADNNNAYKQEAYAKFGAENFGEASRAAVEDMVLDIATALNNR